ncbi:MAG: NAD-glutamate dehydrogenase, partial [Devosia sp.]
CLRNNYLQTLALSLAERESAVALREPRLLGESLERRHLLDRAVEFLPDDATLDARATAGRGFTRPELAVLLAYAKNSLQADLIASPAPDDPYLARDLFAYFPARLATEHREAIETHRLRREVIATVLANAMINSGGPSFVVELMSATSADAAAVAHAYAVARDAFGLSELNRRLDGLDGLVPSDLQLSLYADVAALLRRQTLWFLRNETFEGGLSELAARYALGVADIRRALGAVLPTAIDTDLGERTTGLAAQGVPMELARQLAELPVIGAASDISLVANRTGSEVLDAARSYFAIVELFGLGRLAAAAERLKPADRFDRMALDRAAANLSRAQRDLASDVLGAGSGLVEDRLRAWRAARETAISRATAAVAEVTQGGLTVSRLSVAAGLLADLARGT